MLPLLQGLARACVRRAAAGVLLHFRGYSLQPDLVRHDGMALLLRHSGACLYAKTQTGTARNMRWYHIGVLCFAGSEYLLWTVGCFWPDTSLASPTFWFDMLLTLAIFGLLPAARKAVEA